MVKTILEIQRQKRSLRDAKFSQRRYLNGVLKDENRALYGWERIKTRSL